MEMNNKNFSLLNLLQQMKLGGYVSFKYCNSIISIQLVNFPLKKGEIKNCYYYECDTINEELDCHTYDSLQQLLDDAMIEGKKIQDICDNIELLDYNFEERHSQSNNFDNKACIKKGFIIGIVLGIIIGLIVGTGINPFTKKCSVSNENLEKIVDDENKKFIGRWEYGDRNIETELNKYLNEYEEKYELKTGSWSSCIYGDNNTLSIRKSNNTLIINEDKTVEYIYSYGYIDENCKVKILINEHYKGTFENSKIVFKQKEVNGEWNEFRSVHNIYLVDSETLHYKVNDENASSATYLFIKIK